MNMHTYQVRTREYAIYPDVNLGTLRAVVYCGYGLGEAGEVQGKIKKVLRGDKTLKQAKREILEELGDVLWYIARLADELGDDLDELARRNLKKLDARVQAGTIQGDGDER